MNTTSVPSVPPSVKGKPFALLDQPSAQFQKMPNQHHRASLHSFVYHCIHHSKFRIICWLDVSSLSSLDAEPCRWMLTSGLSFGPWKSGKPSNNELISKLKESNSRQSITFSISRFACRLWQVVSQSTGSSPSYCYSSFVFLRSAVRVQRHRHRVSKFTSVGGVLPDTRILVPGFTLLKETQASLSLNSKDDPVSSSNAGATEKGKTRWTACYMRPSWPLRVAAPRLHPKQDDDQCW